MGTFHWLTWGDTLIFIPLTVEDCEVLQYKTRSNCSCQFHCCSAQSGLLSKTNLVLVAQRSIVLVAVLTDAWPMTSAPPWTVSLFSYRTWITAVPVWAWDHSWEGSSGPVRCWACIDVQIYTGLDINHGPWPQTVTLWPPNIPSRRPPVSSKFHPHTVNCLTWQGRWFWTICEVVLRNCLEKGRSF